MYGNMDDGGETAGLTSSGSFSENVIRRGFIRRVFGILSVQLGITMAIMGVFFIENVRLYAKNNAWLFFVAFAVSIVALIALSCCGDLRRKTPHNMIFLGLFTCAEGFLLGTITSVYSANEVLLAVGICGLVSLSLIIFALQTKIDFTMFSGILFVAVMCLFFFGLFAIIFPGKVISIVYASLGALIFSCYIVVDVQLMMGGKHKYAIDPEEYVFASLNIYLDIINLFLMILSLIGNSRN